ncbi:MAG: hypothetical protein IPM26_02305 [Saprospiraceae bacterium]|jgi:hypothetical protein|nr:hypothetical protein [Saprospiraceae bacterium]
MYNFLVKNGITAAMGLGVLIIVIFMVTILTGLKSAGFDSGTDLLQQDMTKINFFNFGLYATFFLCVVALLMMTVGVVWDMIRNFKTGKKFIFGIVGLVVLFIILYSMSKFETGGKWDTLNANFGITEGSSKLISAGIYTCGILLAISALSIVVSEVRGFFK